MNDDPITDAEWQTMALVARGALLFAGAKAHGLVQDGPRVDVARCEELLARARARGIVVDDDAAAAEAFVVFEYEERARGAG